MTLDEFFEEVKDDLAKFQAAYLLKHNENPEHYPLELPKDNDGVWFESFIFFLQEGKV